MEKLFDTHAHYDDERFTEYEGGRDNLLARLLENDAEYILGVGCDIESSKKQIEYAEKYDGFYAAVGIHPQSADGFELSELEGVISALEELARHKKVRAIGEIGLDRHWESNPPLETQIKVFEAQLALAERLNLPVCVHAREAIGASIECIKKYNCKGVFHAYSGSVETASELVKMGYYISFPGVITYKNAKTALEVLASLPSERILLETDCPYLAPVPYRGKTNHSGLSRFTAEKMGEILGMTADEVIILTRENGKRLFGI